MLDPSPKSGISMTLNKIKGVPYGATTNSHACPTATEHHLFIRLCELHKLQSHTQRGEIDILYFKDVLDHGFIVLKQSLFYNGSKIWWKRTEHKVAAAHDFIQALLS